MHSALRDYTHQLIKQLTLRVIITLCGAQSKLAKIFTFGEINDCCVALHTLTCSVQHQTQ